MTQKDKSRKTILITGASGGIGQACSEIFANQKFNVIMVDINKNELLFVSDKLKNEGLSVLPIYADVSDIRSVKNMVNESLEFYGKIDVLVNNAAVQTVHPFLELPISEWQKVINTNLTGTFLCSQQVSLAMKKYGGRIINMLSVHYAKPRKNKVHYDCSKAAVSMLTKEMALELFKYGITVNAISFGAVNTPMNADWVNDKIEKEKVLSKIPLKKIFEPQDVAKFTYEIINDFSEYTTGTIFNIDAGRSLM